MATINNLPLKAIFVKVNLPRNKTGVLDEQNASVSFDNALFLGGDAVNPVAPQCSTQITAGMLPVFSEPHPQFAHASQMLDWVLSYMHNSDANLDQIPNIQK